MKINISRAAFIAAASICQAVQDLRLPLNGILIEKGPDNKPLIVATDGHRLVAALDENGSFDDDGLTVQTIIAFGPETLRAAKLVKNLEQPVIIDVQSALDVHVTLGVLQGTELGNQTTNDSKTIDGRFPDWQRVIKDSRKRAIGWYSSKYLADFAKVAKFLNYQGSYDRAITLRADNKNSAAAVHFGGIDYAFGMLMPMRIDDDMPNLPAWAVGPLKKAA